MTSTKIFLCVASVIFALAFILSPKAVEAAVVWEAKVSVTSVKNNSGEDITINQQAYVIISPVGNRANYVMKVKFIGSTLHTGSMTNAFTFQDSGGTGSGYNIYIQYGSYWFLVGNIGTIFNAETTL